jgi:hypothetical protein
MNAAVAGSSRPPKRILRRTFLASLLTSGALQGIIAETFSVACQYEQIKRLNADQKAKNVRASP